jgi:O-6-methylguanine DNA methyltransferase
MKESLHRTQWEFEGVWYGAAWSSKGIVALDYFRRRPSEVLPDFHGYGVHAVLLDEAPPYMLLLREQLARYFSGVKLNFNVPLDLSRSTPFQEDVWRAARRIPYGKTVSYGSLAARIGHPRAARAVGSALGANPVPILVPCHRVLARGGGLGGFSRGLEIKKRLLRIEGIPYIA